MAGSYEMVREAWSLVENMGDACEAVEELLWLVQSQIGTTEAERLLNEQYYPMIRGELEKDSALLEVEKCNANIIGEINGYCVLPMWLWKCCPKTRINIHPWTPHEI